MSTIKTTYLVGGYVRDELLGVESKDKDLVIVGTNVEEMKSLGHKLVGKDFPVFIVDGDEVALARTERKIGVGHQGFECEIKNVTLEQDLERRDLTINSIAKHKDGTYIDPYGGIQDIENKILRHTSNSFNEDPVRVLRVARLLARYSNLGFTVHISTLIRLKEVVSSKDFRNITQERILLEIEKTLSDDSPWVFFEFLEEIGALKIILPEISNLFGVPQPEAHHPEIDTWVHTKMSLMKICGLTDDVSVRFSVLVHDIGKGLTPKEDLPSHIGHEESGSLLFEEMAKRLKLSNKFKKISSLVIKYHTHCHRLMELKPGKVVTLLTNLDVFKQGNNLVEEFAMACLSDATGRKNREDEIYPQYGLLIELTKLSKLDYSDLVEKYEEGVLLGQNINQRKIKEAATIRGKYVKERIG